MARLRVHLSEHAKVRLGQRVHLPIDVSLKQIASGLATVLCLGVHPGPELSVPVLLPGGYTAICRPEAAPYSGWIVVTVLDAEAVTREQMAEVQRLVDETKKEVSVQ